MLDSTKPIFLYATVTAIFNAIFSTIPWVAVFILTQTIGIRLYVLKDKETCKALQKRLIIASHTTDEGKSYGISIGRWYYASVSVYNSDHGDTYEIWMIATETSYKRLASPVEATLTLPVIAEPCVIPAPRQNITVYERTGSFYNPWFRRRIVGIDTVESRPEQSIIMDTIIQHFRGVGNHTSVLLYGPPGTGKSMIGILLAVKLGAVYCNTLRPWQPGDTLSELYIDTEPTQDKPLILVFDEVDSALVIIHAGIAPHKQIPILIPDKSGWNRFMDEIGRGMYPHLILLLTSNRSPQCIDSLDSSYIRNGRVDLRFAVGKFDDCL